ncbi:MAG: hypothetical protein ABIB47_03145 [Candidatus Woesearchaeota archaeon]
MKEDIEKIIERIVIIVLVVFGLYISYQIIKRILGGSLTAEDIIISLLIFNLGCVFTIGFALAKLNSGLAKLKSDHNHLRNQFRSLADDFKRYVKK